MHVEVVEPRTRQEIPLPGSSIIVLEAPFHAKGLWQSIPLPIGSPLEVTQEFVR